jgi:hypothetical protein
MAMPTKPVAVRWFGSRALLRELRRIMRLAVEGDAIDARDWMEPNVMVFAAGGVCGQIAPEDWDTPPEEPAEGAIWFDYVADTGDDWYATHDIAYWLHGDVWAAPDGELHVSPPPSADGREALRLPRGAFLIFGGDTAYYVASEPTIRQRVVDPYNAAYQVRFQGGPYPPARPFFGIPGNHDWYDSLDGFGRLFRMHAPTSAPAGAIRRPTTEGPIELDGHTPQQLASYFAIRLPWDWDLWALDIQKRYLDFRQVAFFVELLRRWHPTSAAEGTHKLVLLSAVPAVETGFRNDHIEAELKRVVEPPGLKLPKPRLRLDLAGDTHNYQRYELGDDGVAAGGRRMTVVAGGGGAFLHPTHKRPGSISVQHSYPSAAQSYRLSHRLLQPLYIYNAGMLAVFLVVLQATILTRLATPQHGGWLIHLSGLAGLYAIWVDLGLPRRRPQTPTLGHQILALLSGVVVYFGVWPWLLEPTHIAWRIVGSLLAAAAIVYVWAGLYSARSLYAVVLAVILGLLAYLLTAWLFGGNAWLPYWWMAVLFAGFLLFGVLAEGLDVFRRPQALWGRLLLASFAFALVDASLPLLGLVIRWVAGEEPSYVATALGWVMIAILSPLVLGAFLFIVPKWIGWHGNTAFSALRYPGYKHFIRFKLERDQLTGYVLGLDRPSSPRHPTPSGKLLDVFTLT